MLTKILVISPFLLWHTNAVQAQYVAGKNEVGIHVGTLIYQGDLSPQAIGSVKTAKPNLGIYYNRILTNYWSARVTLNVGSLMGDDSRFANPAYMQHRNFAFSSPVVEVSAMAVYNIYGNNDYFRKFSTYLFGGAGVSFVHIKRDASRIDTSYFGSSAKAISGLAADSAKRLPRVLPVLPMGLGLKYAILPRLSLVAEGTYRYTFSDYLDGFSQAANPKLKDSYYGLTIGAVFNFGKNKMACPPSFKER